VFEVFEKYLSDKGVVLTHEELQAIRSLAAEKKNT